MLASNRTYDAFYRRPGQTMHPMLHDQLIHDPYTGQYSSKRDTPELESKPSITHRKRVPVACDRCRKRKIKCSGDQGDGSGCDNCRSAGYDSCQFLRVRSSLLDVPSITSSRGWQGSHYHPYSSRSRHLHHLHHSQAYAHQTSPAYQNWPSSIDYTGMANSSTTTMPWGHSTYAPTFGLCDNGNTGSYSQQTPSYMQPDPNADLRSNINNSYMTSMERPQQNSLWLSHLDTQPLQQHSQISQIYPLTPAESTKSYHMFGGHIVSHPISNERALSIGRLHTPAVTTALPLIPSHGRDTPPLSAVSHRSSHTWNTDTASHISTASSRTSCGGSQDLSNGQLATCEDQTAVYPFSADSTSPHVNIPASALPIATDAVDHEPQPAQAQDFGLPSTDGNGLLLRSRHSRESLRTASPISTIYGYVASGSRSSRRSHTLHSTGLLSGVYDNSWDQAAIPETRHDSLSGQQGNPEQLPEHRGSIAKLSSVC